MKVREGVNARYLKPSDFDEQFDLATIDVSFISLTKILPAVVPLLTETGRIVALIKPQFEVGKGEIGKGGIVKDPAQHQRVVQEINAAAESLGLKTAGVIESPIKGADGNVEFLALYVCAPTELTTELPRHAGHCLDSFVLCRAFVVN